MTRLSMDPLTLTHVLITLVAILAGFVVLGRMYISRVGNGWTGTFLAASILTSVTGFVFFHPPHPPTPAQATGAAALVVLAPTLYALYVRHLVGVWRPVYVIGAVISLWLNVFVLIIQIFQKVPALQALAGNPPSGPVFAAVQGIVLVAFIVAGWGGVKHFHPIGA
ncbi:MAG: hypothetical protein JF604_02235 [Bradyrhizobium sp.]|nr:hypothetical protein [Bradyrhizobium sp.]